MINSSEIIGILITLKCGLKLDFTIHEKHDARTTHRAGFEKSVAVTVDSNSINFFLVMLGYAAAKTNQSEYVVYSLANPHTEQFGVKTILSFKVDGI
jgi:hypothetical protein